MTLDELFEKYHEAWSAVARQTDGDRQSAGRAGIRAVVAAIRDNMVSELEREELNEILASDGVEAAGSE
jgi:hypothetical protein